MPTAHIDSNIVSYSRIIFNKNFAREVLRTRSFCALCYIYICSIVHMIGIFRAKKRQKPFAKRIFILMNICAHINMYCKNKRNAKVHALKDNVESQQNTLSINRKRTRNFNNFSSFFTSATFRINRYIYRVVDMLRSIYLPYGAISI